MTLATQLIDQPPPAPLYRASTQGIAGSPVNRVSVRVVVYWVLALALYGQAAHEEVLRWLVEGLGWGGADQVFDRQV